MVRFLLLGGALIALSACDPSIPDSGVSSNPRTTSQAQAQRDAALAQNTAAPGLPAPAPVQSSTLNSDPAAQPLPASVTAAVTGDPADVSASQQAAASNSGVAPVDASPSNPAPVQVNAAGISSEQDFNTVSSQRTIQSDANRIAANRAQYTVIAPTDLPTRPGTNQPNIVEYALRTKNPVGAALYRRSGLRSAQRGAAACRKYPSPDQAQIDFLVRGGPQKDRLGLDPDGDGFACSWDPRPFRAARASTAPAPASAPATTQTQAPAASSQVDIVQPLVISTE